MAVGTPIELSTLQAWQDRLNSIYSTHDLSYTYVVFDANHPLSEDVKELYQKFQAAYSEEHLANAVKWTIDDGELDVGALIKWQTAEDVDTSLTSMEAQTHYSRVVNTAGTTYTQTTNTNAATYSETYYSAYRTNTVGTRYNAYGTTYGQITNSNVSGGYSTGGYGQTAYERGIGDVATVYKQMPGNGQTTHTAGTNYTRTANSVTITYTET